MGCPSWGSSVQSPFPILPFSIRAHTCIAPVPHRPPSPLDQPPRGQWQKGGGRNRNDDDFGFLLSEPGEGGCFASWTSVENSLPDNHLGAFIAF